MGARPRVSTMMGPVMMMMIVCLASSLIAMVSATETPGRSTFYSGIDQGACGFGTIPTSTFPYGYIGAANTAFFASSTVCGNCYEIECVGAWGGGSCSPSCTGNTVTIQISDECPAGSNSEWCSGDVPHFDLSEPAFAQLANTQCGVIQTQFRQVTCPVTSGMDIVVQQKDGVNAWWFAIFLLNVGGTGGLQSVSIKDSSAGASWQTMARQSNNFWVVQSSAGLVAPMSVQITGTDGQQLTFTNVITSIVGSQNIHTGQQFAASTAFGSGGSGTVLASSATSRAASSTGTSSSSSSTVGALAVYTDAALSTGWGDWSWSITQNYAYTGPPSPEVGSSCVSITSAQWGGWYLHYAAGISVSSYYALQMWIYSATANPGVGIGLYVGSAQLGSINIPGSVPANTWTQVTVPFASVASMTASTVLSGICFQSSASITYYVDDVKLLSGSAQMDVSPSTSQFTAPSGSQKITAPSSTATNERVSLTGSHLNAASSMHASAALVAALGLAALAAPMW